MNMNISRAASQHDEQVVRFSDQTPDWVYSVPSQPDSTFKITDTNDSTLENFFQRPVRIAQFMWAVNTSNFQYIDPWASYLHNLRVINRINNFNLLRAKLHVKIILNGNGFYSGRLLVSYVPRPTEMSGVSLPRDMFGQDAIKLSQLPHILLDPTTSQGGELILPFFHTENNLSIPADEFAQMGVLMTRDLTILQHANGGTDPVSVTVYCWAEGLELAIPTTTRNGSMVAQMGDEYGLKPVSKTANAVAHAAGALSAIPSIAPYAKATKLAAEKIGEVASIFGYSRPPTLDPPKFVLPQVVGDIANVNLPEGLSKLTLDSKQEVTVDPRVVGLDSADEMSILSLAKRESYINTMMWTVDNSVDSVLGSHTVSPMKFHKTSGLPYNTEYTLTPLAFATLPFRYWRGSLKFRFQVVASAFHKGRLRIVYDPYVLQSASVGEYNVNYSYVVDIAEEKDFTLTFGWGQPLTWRPVSNLPDTYYPYGVDGGIVPLDASVCASNGALSVIVVNELTVPNSVDAHPIYINVFVSAGDDFEVCVPNCENINELSYSAFSTGPGLLEDPPKEEFQSQAGDDSVVDTGDLANNSIPVTQEVQHVMAPILPTDHTQDVFFGDPVVSFRQCLKRYNLSRAWYFPSAANASATRFLSFRVPDVPLYRGGVDGAIDRAVHPSSGASLPFNFCKMTLLNYLLPAFAARRGGIRWKYHLTGHNPNYPGHLMVTAGNPGQGYFRLETAPVSPDNSQAHLRSASMDSLLPHTWCASHVTAPNQNPVLEFETPFYTNKRFFPTRDLNVTDSGRFSTSYHTIRVLATSLAGPPINYTYVTSYVSVGEDFNLFFFTYIPTLYSMPNPVGATI